MSGPDYPYRQAEGLPQGKTGGSEPQATIRRIVEPILASLGLVLVDVESRGQGRKSLLRVVIERVPAENSVSADISLEDCERVHMLLGHALDVEEPVRHAYTLEVSSPGLDRPIRKAGEYERFKGRLARFKLVQPIAGQAVVVGRILRLEDAQVWVQPEREVRRRKALQREGARSPKADGVPGPREKDPSRPALAGGIAGGNAVALPLAAILEARLEVEF